MRSAAKITSLNVGSIAASGMEKLTRSPMTDLSLEQSGRRREDHYDVIADGVVGGRIIFFSAKQVGRRWMWAIAPGYEKDRAPTHGYEVTLEAATQAFARCWYRGDVRKRVFPDPIILRRLTRVG
jgi:hypothetical protein